MTYWFKCLYFLWVWTFPFEGQCSQIRWNEGYSSPATKGDCSLSSWNERKPIFCVYGTLKPLNPECLVSFVHCHESPYPMYDLLIRRLWLANYWVWSFGFVTGDIARALEYRRGYLCPSWSWISRDWFLILRINTPKLCKGFSLNICSLTSAPARTAP